MGDLLLYVWVRISSCWGHQPIRWSKNRDAEDRLDVAAIPDPDLLDHRLHHSLALRQRSILQGALDMGVAFEDVLCHVVHVDRGRSVLRAPGGPVDLDRYALRGGSRVDQVKRCVRAGVGE
jgi:hypothetical protein